MPDKYHFVIGISSLAVLLCIGQTNPQQNVPPLLMEFTIQTHSWFCPNTANTVLVLNKFSSTASLQEHLLQKLNTPLVVLYNSQLLRTMLLSVRCVLFFSYRSYIFTYFLLSEAKLIVLMEDVEFYQQYPNISVQKLISYNTAFILYNNTSYRSFRVDFPTRELIHNGTSVATSEKLNNLHHAAPRFAFSPSTISKSMQKFWKTIASRHNFTYVQPGEIASIFFGLIQAIQKTGFSMHRSVSTCFIIVPTNRQRPLGYLLIDPFDLPTWICVVITIATVLLLLWIVDRPRFNFSRTILEMVQILINNPHERSRHAAHRLIITIFITGSFILTSSYESLLTATISRPSLYPPLNDLDIINRSCKPMWKLDSFDTDFKFIHEASANGEVDLTPGCFVGSHAMAKVVLEICRKDPEYVPLSYAMSPAEMVAFPAMGYLVSGYHGSLMELLRFYASAFAQAGLLHSVDGGSPDQVKPVGRKLKALSFGELQLVWKLAAYGWGLSFVIFCVELLRIQFHKFCEKMENSPMKLLNPLSLYERY